MVKVPELVVQPVGHGGQLGPPQSTPVSWPFCMPSVQVGVGEPGQADKQVAAVTLLLMILPGWVPKPLVKLMPVLVRWQYDMMVPPPVGMPGLAQPPSVV